MIVIACPPAALRSLGALPFGHRFIVINLIAMTEYPVDNILLEHFCL